MYYFSNFETKFFKLFATALIATGRRATVGQQGRRQKIFQGGGANGKKDQKLAKNTEK